MPPLRFLALPLRDGEVDVMLGSNPITDRKAERVPLMVELTTAQATVLIDALGAYDHPAAPTVRAQVAEALRYSPRLPAQPPAGAFPGQRHLHLVP